MCNYIRMKGCVLCQLGRCVPRRVPAGLRAFVPSSFCVCATVCARACLRACFLRVTRGEVAAAEKGAMEDVANDVSTLCTFLHQVHTGRWTHANTTHVLTPWHVPCTLNTGSLCTRNAGNTRDAYTKHTPTHTHAHAC